jgi:adenylate cyclase
MNEGREQRAERRLAAILAADVAGYSRLMGADEEGTLAALKAIRRELSNPKIAEHRGRIVKTTGDGVLVEFASVVDAVRCAVEVQQAMAERNRDLQAERRIEFRVGINLGDIISDEHDIYGEGVNVAARLEALADPGRICVSGVVRDQVRDRLDIAFDDLGEQQVKNIARPVHVYRIGPRPSRPHAGETPAVRPSLPLPDKQSLAVLPFQNMSGDPEQEYFADGMVEEITTAIARLPWLFVIARNSSFTYKGKAVDVKQVARELGVRYVLEGSVRKAGNRVRITGQLIDTATGAHIWSDRFDGALDDIFELQDQVASSVVGVIEPKLHLAETERAIRKPTENLSAYDLYLRAAAQTRLRTPEAYHQALDMLQRAMAIDRNYAPAAALIARCRLAQRVQGWGPVSDAEIADAVRLLRHALETAKDDPNTLASAAYTLSSFVGEHAAAARAIECALVLNPNSAETWTAKGWVSCYQGDAESAMEAFDRAMRLSPLDPRGYHIKAGQAFARMIVGRYAEAIEWADRSLSEQPRYNAAIRAKIVALAQLGRVAEAHTLLARLIELQPGLTIAGFRIYAASNFPPELLAIYIDGLRQAGLPEE